MHDNSASSSGGVDIDTLIKSVINDMLAVEKGSQWLLSCYGPFKEKQVFPSFNDYSFEEIRYGFYEAVKSGTIEQYVSTILTICKILYYNTYRSSAGLSQHAMLSRDPWTALYF